MKRSPSWRTAMVIVFGVLGLAAAVSFAVRSWPSDTLDVATVIARSQEAEAIMLAEATEGKAIHLVDTVYRRHGPAAARIRAMSDDWYLPESYQGEVWIEIGGGGKISRVYGSVADEEGTIYQEIRSAGDEVVTRDVATGAEHRTPLDMSVKDMADSVRRGAQAMEERLAEGSATIVGYGDIAGRKTIILELSQRPEIPPAQPGSEGQEYSTGYSIPYTLDLNGVERVERTEVDSETFSFPSRWSVVVIDADGREHLVEERTMVTFEIVDAGEVPVGVFSDPQGS